MAKPANDGSLKLVVDRLEAEAPAAASGLAAGDRIKSVGGAPVARQVDFERALLGRSPGDKVEVIVERSKKIEEPAGEGCDRSRSVKAARQP